MKPAERWKPAGGGLESAAGERARFSPVRTDIRSLSAYAVPESEGMVKLDAMENPRVLPVAVRRRLGAALARVEANRYPDPAAQRLKQLLRERDAVSPEREIVLGNGSDELIQMLMIACCAGDAPGSAVMGFAPSFVMYEQLARIAGAQWSAVPLDQMFGIRMEQTLEEIARIRPRLLLIASPNNPTGNAFPAPDLARLAEAMAGCGWLVLDEAYAPYSDPGLHGEYRRRLEALPHVLFMRTFSKLGLAGIRLGYLSATAEDAADLEKVRLPYNINSYTQTVAAELLEQADLLEWLAKPVIKERGRLARWLGAIPGVTVHPSLGNFLLLEVPGAEAAWRALWGRGVLVKHLKPSPSGHLQSHLRVTVGTPKENRLLADALGVALKEATLR